MSHFLLNLNWQDNLPRYEGKQTNEINLKRTESQLVDSAIERFDLSQVWLIKKNSSRCSKEIKLIILFTQLDANDVL